jgi:hypothetical protein
MLDEPGNERVPNQAIANENQHLWLCMGGRQLTVWYRTGKSLKTRQRAGAMAQVVEHLAGQHKALNSNPSNHQKPKNQTKPKKNSA